MELLKKNLCFWAILLLSQLTSAQIVDSVDFYINSYNYPKALELLDKSNNTDHLIKRAAILKNLNRYQEAIVCYEELLENNQEDVEIIVDLAGCFEAINNFREAQKQLLQALQIQPENILITQKLANTYFQSDDFYSAVEYYHKAELANDNYFIAKQLARCYEKMDSIDQSITYYTKALDINQSDYLSTLRLANIFSKLRETFNGINLTERYLRIDSTNTKIMASNAYFYFLDKNYPEAVSRFEKCLQLKDTSFFVTKNLGYSYFKNQEYEEAKTYLEKAFLRDSTNAELCYLTGLACAYSVFKKDGIEYLNKSIALLTPSPQLLSSIYNELGKANTGYYQYNEGLNSYLKAYELNPADTILIFTIASHYDNWIKDKEKALEYYQKFMKTRPQGHQSQPIDPNQKVMIVSYYDYVEKRIDEIKKEGFWNKE